MWQNKNEFRAKKKSVRHAALLVVGEICIDDISAVI
jgi:hypothetical protein